MFAKLQAPPLLLGFFAALLWSGCDFFLDLDQAFPPVKEEPSLDMPPTAQRDLSPFLDSAPPRDSEKDAGEVPKTFEGYPILFAPRATGAITIDGVRDDAYGSRRYTYTFLGAEKDSENVVQVSATWDAQRLYVIYEITDLSSFVLPDEDKLWACDCMDMYFNTGRTQEVGKGVEKTMLNGDDIHVIVDVSGRHYYERGNAPDPKMRAVFAVNTPPLRGYAIEVSIERDVFTLDLLAGRIYGAHFASADCDRGREKDPKETRRFSWQTMQDWNNRIPNTWGVLKLVEK